MYRHLQAKRGADALNVAYFAAAQALSCRHDWNPMARLEGIRQAWSSFEQAVSLQPDHPEPRFLRISIERHVPAFVPLTRYLHEDLRIFLENILAHERFDIPATDAAEMTAFLHRSRIGTVSQLQKTAELLQQLSSRT